MQDGTKLLIDSTYSLSKILNWQRIFSRAIEDFRRNELPGTC
jgi:hypothetical protein